MLRAAALHLVSPLCVGSTRPLCHFNFHQFGLIFHSFASSRAASSIPLDDVERLRSPNHVLILQPQTRMLIPTCTSCSRGRATLHHIGSRRSSQFLPFSITTVSPSKSFQNFSIPHRLNQRERALFEAAKRQVSLPPLTATSFSVETLTMLTPKCVRLFGLFCVLQGFLKMPASGARQNVERIYRSPFHPQIQNPQPLYFCSHVLQDVVRGNWSYS